MECAGIITIKGKYKVIPEESYDAMLDTRVRK